jgi:hypothetical protein
MSGQPGAFSANALNFHRDPICWLRVWYHAEQPVLTIDHDPVMVGVHA